MCGRRVRSILLLPLVARLPRDNRCVCMALCFHVCFSDCVAGLWECVAGVVKIVFQPWGGEVCCVFV